MSIALSGLLGIAVKIIPDLFKLVANEREGGAVSEEAKEIVSNILQTEDETEAAQRVASDELLSAELGIALAELKKRAIEEKRRAEEKQQEIDEAFLALEQAERTQAHQHQMALIQAELESTEQARAFALEASKSGKWWVAGINPFLSYIIVCGFIAVLLFIFFASEINNIEIIYTAIGTIATAFATVIGFHFGSSSGSKEKDEMVVNTTPYLETSQSPEMQTHSPTTQTTLPGAKITEEPAPTASKPARPDPGGTFGLFRQKAPEVMQDLMSDFGMTLDQAAGVLGNIGHECAGFRTMQEIKPIVKGSRGGWGWCQWTGPRRVAFENWCADNGFNNLSDDDANYGFLKYEFETTESAALTHLRKTQSLSDATRSFMNKFERPGKKHFSSRLKWAREARKSFQDTTA